MAGISVQDVRVRYEGGGRSTEALGGIGLLVPDGEPVAVIGPSGCGKSTLLLALAGLVAPSSGSVSVDDTPVSGPRLRTGLILQDFGLLPWKTVAENAALGLRLRGALGAGGRGRVRDALERLGLGGFEDAYPAELSGGMRQRLALARVLALDADLLLMDEPLSALDALTREDLQALLLDLWRRRGHTQVLVTHSIEEAVFLGRRVIVMSPRPGTIAAIVDNPEMGEPGFRETPAFLERCVRLRHLLAAEGALGDGAATAFAGGTPDASGGAR